MKEKSIGEARRVRVAMQKEERRPKNMLENNIKLNGISSHWFFKALFLLLSRVFLFLFFFSSYTEATVGNSVCSRAEDDHKQQVQKT